MYQLRREDIYDQADTFRQNHTRQNSEERSLLRAIILFRSQVLTDKSRKRQHHRGNRDKDKAFDLGMSAGPCHGEFTERINIRLDDNVADADNRVLNAGRKPLLNYLLHHLRIPLNLLPADPGVVLTLPHPHQAEQHTESLGKNRRKSSARDTLMKLRNQQQIQYNIYNR